MPLLTFVLIHCHSFSVCSVLCRSHSLGSDPSPEMEVIERPRCLSIRQAQTPSQKFQVVRVDGATKISPGGGANRHHSIIVFREDMPVGAKPEWQLISGTKTA